MRGTPLQETHRPRPNGIIPAYAGNTPDVARRACLSGDHPRVCGEHSHSPSAMSVPGGSSPHMRGTHPTAHVRPIRRGIIPAYAGNTSVGCMSHDRTGDHPRICGEHLKTVVPMVPTVGSSPHMRGTHRLGEQGHVQPGIIPAYAGNTRCRRCGRCRRGDHPRICGEH